MDPLSITAGVVGILDSVSRLNSAISEFRDDYQLADEDLCTARKHALLLREEITALGSRKQAVPSPFENTAKRQTHHEPEQQAKDESSLEKAISIAGSLLSDIETAFPLRPEPHTWKSKARWALKDKKLMEQLQDRLQSVESTLQGIVSMEQLRISRVIYKILLQQQATLDKIERGEILGQQVIQMAVINQADSKLAPTVLQARLSEIEQGYLKEQYSDSIPASRTITQPTKLLPRTNRFDWWGFSAQLVTLPGPRGTNYRAAVHVSLLGRRYSVQLRLSSPSFPLILDRTLHVSNIVPETSDMVIACKTGDFDRALSLLTSHAARGSDVTASGWPMLDLAIESGSTRLVRLLLEHGANPDIGYVEYNMTALQSCFLRHKLDMARVLLSKGADIEHVDSDGYSVLSYLWVVDGQLQHSGDFMRLLLSNGFSEVNACDERGWTAFHRAAAIGTADDVGYFLRLGASLDLRAEWYGWTALFFAASHDNVQTFQTIVKHSGPGVYDSLDGDGWSILHCCVYFGAPRVMRLVLRSGIDVNQKSLPAPLPEDPGLSYKELTAADIALYIGPNRYKMFMDALTDTGRDVDLTGDEVFWDATGDDMSHEGGRKGLIYGVEDVVDRWTLLHWASYNGSPKVKRLLLLKGADPEHLDAIILEDNPTTLPTSRFDAR